MKLIIMKLIIQNNRIAGTATDAYAGPDEFIDAPADFDINRIADYVVDAGVAVLPAPGVPQQVTMRQARLALLGAGLLGSVDAAIAALPSPQKEAAQIEWEFASTVDRDSVFLGQMAGALNLGPSTLDALFVAAARL